MSGVVRCPSLSVMEKRLPSPSMTLSEVVSPTFRESSPPAPAAPDSVLRKERGELGCRFFKFAGSPHGGMSWKARLRSTSRILYLAYCLE
jgi:hypothetical protein